jgi:hypothetical protein
MYIENIVKKLRSLLFSLLLFMYTTILKTHFVAVFNYSGRRELFFMQRNNDILTLFHDGAPFFPFYTTSKKQDFVTNYILHRRKVGLY